jgi:hypothetical protein
MGDPRGASEEERVREAAGGDSGEGAVGLIAQAEGSAAAPARPCERAPLQLHLGRAAHVQRTRVCAHVQRTRRLLPATLGAIAARRQRQLPGHTAA